MSKPSLNIEINALINGLQDLANFQRELSNTGSALQSIAPVATQASTSLTEIEGNASGAGSAFGRLGASTGSMSSQVGAVSTSINGASQDVAELADAAADLADITVDLGSGLDDVGYNAEQFGSSTSGALADATESVGRFSDSSVQLSDMSQSLADAASAAAEAGAEIADATAEVADATDEADGSVNRLSLGFRSFAESAAPETTSRITDLSSGLTDLRDQSQSSEGRVELLGAGLGKLAGLAGVAAGALIAIVGAINLKEAVEYAARLETMNKVMVAVGNNAGYSREQLTDYESQITSLGISSIAAKEAIAQMASAGLELGDVSGNGTSQVAELAEAAQNLSIVAGTDASEALSNLIINVKQLDTEGLRNMGIVLDQAAAQDQYAEKVGKSAGALTEAEKQQAAMNYVLSEAGKLNGVYAASLDTLDSRLSSMGTAQSNIAASIGQLLLPAYKALISESATFLETTSGIIDNNIDIAASSDTMQNAVSSGASAIFGVLEGVIKLGASIVDEVVEIGSGMVEAFASAWRSVTTLFTAFNALESETNSLEISLKAVSFAVAAIADGFAVVELAVRTFVSGVQTAGAGVLDMVASITSLKDSGAAENLREMAAEMREGAKANSDAAKQIVDDFAKGDSAVLSFISSLREVKAELGEIGTGNTFDELNQDILTLTAAQRQGIISSTDLSDNLNKVKDRMDALGESGALSAAEVSKLGGSLAVLAKDITTEYNDAISNMGLTVASLSSGVSDDVSTLSGSLQTLAENARTEGAIFNQAFSFSLDQAANITELALLTDASKVFAERVMADGESATGTLAQIGEATLLARGKFEELFDAQLGAAKTEEDFRLLTEQVKKFGEEMVQAGLMSEQELGLKLQSIAEQAKEVNENLLLMNDITAFSKLGMDIEEVRTGFSATFNDMLEGFDLLNVSSTATGQVISNAFADVFAGAENVEQLNAIQEKLNESADSGKLFGAELSNASEAATDKFKELFQSSLEAANTSQDFAKLRAEITAAGESGVLSGTDVANAFTDVKEKIESAKTSVLSLAEQARELSNANLAISGAQTEVLRSQMDVTKADLDYQSALNTYREDGTEQSKLDLEVRKNELVLAQERVELAQLKQEVEEANYDMLIAKQKELNAEKRLEIDINNEALIAASNAARAEAEAKALVVSQTQNAYAQQQLVVGATERAALQAQALADKMRQTATNAGAARAAVDGVAEATSRVETSAQKVGVSLKSWTMEGLQNEMAKHISDAEQAAKIGKQIYEEANTNQRRFVMATGTYFTNYGFANTLMAERIEMLDKQEAKEARINERRAAEATRQEQAEAARQQAIDNLANSQQEYVDKLSAETDQVLNYAANVVKQAEYLAATGGDISTAFSSAAKGGMTEAEEQIQRMKDGAQDLIANALSAGDAFLSSASSLEAQLLQAQGKEAELLEYTQKVRRSSLETEYELLKVKLQIAKVTAQEAGVDTSALTNMLSQADAAYKRTQDTLTQLEAIETANQLAASKEAENAAKTSPIPSKPTAASAVAAVQTQSAQASQSTSSSAPVTQQPNRVYHTVTIQKEGEDDAVVEATQDNVDNLINTLQGLKGRSA